jgi:hypothetical protein
MTATFSQRFWRVGRSIAKWTAIVVGALAILIVVAYWEEDWRGACDWTKTKQELIAKGEILDLRKMIPSGRPENDLSKVPLFAEAANQWQRAVDLDSFKFNTIPPIQFDRINTTLGAKLDILPPSEGSYFRRQPVDLAAWQDFYHKLPEAHLPSQNGTPAQDVLRALSQLDDSLQTIHVAVTNPDAYWPENYEHPFTVTVAPQVDLLRVAKVLSLRGSAYLADGKANRALEDYLFLLELMRPEEKNTRYVTFLVDLGVRAIGYSIVWEGIHSHSWNVSQLHEIESALDHPTLLELGIRTYRVERSEKLSSMDFMESSRPSNLVHTKSERDLWSFLRLRPDGWWDQDRLAYSIQIQKQIDRIDLKRGAFAKEEPPRTPSSLRWLYTPLSKVLWTLPGSVSRKMVEAETQRRLAELACRLEEFYLLHQNYPDSISEMGTLPEHLNEEVLTGKPMHYRRENKSYMLYSTGWDGIDHGGVRQSPPYEKDGVSNLRDEWDWILTGP